MSKIEEHAELLIDAAQKLRDEIKHKNWMNTRALLGNIGKHRSVIIAIIEAVEELQPKQQPAVRKRMGKPGYKRSGELVSYIREQIKNLQPNEIGFVRANEQFALDRIRHTTSSVCTDLWGAGNYMTRTVLDMENGQQVVQVFRG